VSGFYPIPPELGIGGFHRFFCYLLRELNLADEPTKQQLAICRWDEVGPQFSITVGFRGIAKSTISGARALHRLRIDPELEKILLVGATSPKAVEVATFMARCIREVDLLRCLEPRQSQRSSVQGFDVGPAVIGGDGAPSVRPVGILSPSLTGKRASMIIPDDIETLANTITAFKQERLWTATTEFTSILLPDAGQALPRQICYRGTPHLETSLYFRLVRERGYKMRMWPARYPEIKDLDAYEGCLDPQMLEELMAYPELELAPTDPERFDEEELLQREAGSTKASWQLQYMLNPRLSTLNRFPIRLGDLIIMSLDGKALPEVVTWASGSEQRINELPCVGLGADRYYHKPMLVQNWLGRTASSWSCVMAIDPAGRGACELAWVVVAELNGNFFVLTAGGTTQGYGTDVLEHLAKTAERWKVDAVIPEPNYGDGMFSKLLEPVLNRIYPCTILEPPRSAGQKERRIIDVLAPLIQQHRMVFSQEFIRSEWEEAERDPETGHERSLMFQLSRITLERGCLNFIDRADALSIAAAHFVENAALDQERQAEQRRVEQQRASLEAWLDETGRGIDSLALGLTPAQGRFTRGLQR
jgi:hypothetical protein